MSVDDLDVAMEPNISPSNDSLPNPENHVNLEGSIVAVSSQDDAELKEKAKKVTVYSQDNAEVKGKVKKPTRQWAAWTHQEEDSFFTALRQVGKNFEKITARIQSKNKDQVRHYYYRLVRRMNKVLGPGLCLDARNSKETNSAMLRWWSLLEKYSCKASKLHLKPRRFKLFAEALESQLLKDRKKVVRRRASQGENCPIIAATSASNQSKVCGPENRAVKAVLVDNQNIQKFGTSKAPSLNRNLSLGVNRGNTKARASGLKTAKFQPKAGIATKAAFKRWEKAAMAAGISLVAAAAEEVERSTAAKDAENHVKDIPAQNGFEHCTKDVPSTMDNIHSSGKLKLQLFPYDDATRRALELDSHNPHLELTLSTRKKIASVVEHLHRKWGHSSIACGELILLPYIVQPVNLTDCHKWTKDSTLSAADVYSHIGTPTVFRLRYGWFSKALLPCGTEKDVDASVPNEQILDATPKSIPQPCQGSQQLSNTSEVMPAGQEVMTVTSSTEMPGEPPISAGTSPECNNITKSPDYASTVALDNRAMIVEDQIQDDLMRDEAALAIEEWPPTNISVGDLLLELPNKGELDCIESAGPRNFQCLQQISQSCDSFDAAIANHILKQQRMSNGQPTLMSHTSSIWDAEDTCDAFSFQKFRNSSPETSGEIVMPNSAASDGPQEPIPNEPLTSNPTQGADLVDNCEPHQHTPDNSPKDFNGLTDIYWPDSLGPLDLDIPSCRYHSDDMILSDSFGGLNRLIASSLDAFQNCSFFGTDKKESATAVEAGEFTSDLKISAEV